MTNDSNVRLSQGNHFGSASLLRIHSICPSTIREILGAVTTPPSSLSVSTLRWLLAVLGDRGEELDSELLDVAGMDWTLQL